MAKKLQHFNTIEEYKAFLRTDDFVPPDISTIGTGSSATTWEVKYNPESMLFICDKKIYKPTDDSLHYTMLSITNGRSNVWWRPSTGGTYTKISNTDLPFYSGDTIGETSSAVTMPARSTDYNNEYIISAISDASTSITASTISKQYGLIELTPPPTFKWEGETLQAQVKTAPGNEWEITNIPSWLTFSPTSGTGPTSISATTEENPDTVERTGIVKIGYINSAVSSYTVTSEFKQEKRNGVYFVFNTDLVNIGSGGTNNYPINYTASGDGAGATVTLQCDKDWVTFVNNPFTSSTSGNITINVGANPDRNIREATVSAKINGNVIDTVQVTQYGHELYFYVSSVSPEDARAHSATSVSFTNIGSADTNNKTVYYATNYTSEELGLDISEFLGGSAATMTTDNTIDFNMNTKSIVTGDTASTTNAKLYVISGGSSHISTVEIEHNAAAYFKFNQTSVTGVSEDGATLTNNLQTNISNSELSLTSSPSISSYSFNSTYLEYTIPANTSAVHGVNYTLTTKWGTNNLQSFTVQQNQKTATFALLPASTDVTNSAYTGYVYLSTNVSDSEISAFTLSVSSDVSWLTITGSDLKNNGHIDFSVSENTSTDERNATITLYRHGTSVSTASVKQDGAIPKYIYITSEGQTSESYTVNSGGTSSKSYVIITNYEQSQLDAMTKNKPDWVNNLSLTTSNVSFGVNAQAIGASSRSGDITFGGIIITVQQEQGEPFKPNLKVNGSTTPGNIGSAVTTFTITTEPNDSSKQYTIYVGCAEITTAGTYSYVYNCGANPETTARTFTVTCESESVSITQEPKHLSFIWNDTSSSGTSETVEKDITSSTKYFTTNYENLTVTHNGHITGATINVNDGTVTASYPVNTGITQQEGTVEVKSNGVTIGTYTIKQNGTAESVTLYLNGTHNSITIGSGETEFNIKVIPSANDFSYNILVSGTTWKSGLTGTSEDTYTCPANPETTARTFTVKVVSTNASDELTVTQNAKAYFMWSNGSTAITETVGSASTSSSKSYTTNYTGLTVSSGGCVTGASISNGTCTANYTANPNTSNRTGYVNIMKGSTVVGTYTVTQNAKAYLWITSTGQTTASTTNITSAGTSLSYNILTNYLQSELDGFSVTKPTWVNTVKLTKSTLKLTFNVDENPVASEQRSGNVVVGGLTVSLTQNAGTPFAPNLKVNGSVTNITIANDTSAFTITTTPNSLSKEYVIYVNDSVITTTSGNCTHVYECGANPGTSSRTFTVKCINDTIVVTQSKTSFIPKLKVNNSTTPGAIGSAETSFTITTEPNDSSIEYTIYVGSTAITTTAGTYSYVYTCGENPETSERTFTVTCEGESVSITQSGKASFIPNLKVNGSTTPENIGSAVTAFTITTEPNVASQQYTIYVGSTAITTTAGTYSYVYNCGENPNTSPITFTIVASADTGDKQEVTITQNAKAYYTIENPKEIDGNSHSNLTITADTNMVGTFYVSAGTTDWLSMPTISSDGKVITIANVNEYTSSGTTTRDANILVRYNTQGGAPIGVCTLRQSPIVILVPNLKVNGSSGSTTIGSGATSFAISTSPNTAYTGNYTIKVNNVDYVTTAGTYSGTYSCGANTGTTNRTFTATCENESVIVTQGAKAYFEWNSTHTSATTETVGSASTSCSESYTTNYTGLSTSASSWITASISNGTCTANYTANPDTTDRTGYIYIKKGSTVVGTYTITQNAKEEPKRFYFLNISGSNVTIENKTSNEVELKLVVDTTVGYIENLYPLTETLSPGEVKQVDANGNIGNYITTAATTINVTLRVVDSNRGNCACHLKYGGEILEGNLINGVCEFSESITVPAGTGDVTINKSVGGLLLS